ncbi:MAG TPA: GAF domain-containing protein [Candidatus Solibacter sp.]|nr:GAF domain-containing protein [Candidatus Solibacter sp.]
MSSPLSAQKRISLAELNKRNSTDYAPVLVGQQVEVRGVVSRPALRFSDYMLVAIQDGESGGLLRFPLTEKIAPTLRPGDDVTAAGPVGTQYGMVVLNAEDWMTSGHKPAPLPQTLSLKEASAFSQLGKLIRLEGKVQDDGYNAGGAVILLETSSKEAYKIFLPQSPGTTKADLNHILRGDTLRATGVTMQYCPAAPYNHGWELVIADMNAVAVVDSPASAAPPVIIGVVALIIIGGVVLWTRERRVRTQRKKLRKTYQLGEEILSASSPSTILQRISDALPGILGVTRVQLYVYNRSVKTLDAIGGEHGETRSISLSSPPGGTPAGAVACFHYRTLLVIPDIDKSPFPIAPTAGERTPKSLLFVPMMAQNEVAGVLELDQDDRVCDFSPDVQALAQHLGNQIGVAIRLLDQRSVQEQLFRTEKLAAIGRLISSVVNELQTPLAHIKDLAHRALDKAHGGPAEREVTAIAAEAIKASSMVQRLLSFAAAEQSEAKPVEINSLLNNLIEFREGDWKASGIRVRNLVSLDPMPVLGSQGQLEQVFLNLLVHAEQTLAQVEQKSLTIRTSLLAKRVLVEISYSAQSELRKPEDTAAVLGVTRGVIGAHGGEVRLIEKNNADPRFEVELPAVRERSAPAPAASMAAPRELGRNMTALVIEPEDSAQRQLVALLSARGFRVVPAANSDAGLDMAQRMRFDAAFVSLHAPGLNWVELSERMHTRVAGFILLSDGYDAELSGDFEGDGRFVLPKPVQEEELDRVLRLVQPRGATVIPFKTGTA